MVLDRNFRATFYVKLEHIYYVLLPKMYTVFLHRRAKEQTNQQQTCTLIANWLRLQKIFQTSHNNIFQSRNSSGFLDKLD